MYKTVLVRELIESGAKLLEGLDHRGFPVRAAVWFYEPERMAWKFVIVTTVAGNPGPHEAYMQIQFAMAGLDSNIALSDIIVMSPESQRFREFKRVIEGAAREALPHSNGSPEGVAFDDAYVYRWLDDAQNSGH